MTRPHDRDPRNTHQMDRARYPWQFRVKDRHGRDRLVGFGVEDGKVVCAGPDYWTADFVVVEQIAFALRGVTQRGRDERTRDEQP